MTNLTDKWKKGELPEGDYYIKRRNGDTPYDNIDSHGVWRNSIDEDIIEVLAEVPSYEECQASENYIDYLKQCISVYKSKDKQATETSIAYNKLIEENQQLKELLKECKPYIQYQIIREKYVGFTPQSANVLHKINQVLGEK